ncbi:hypothetical protein FPOA_09498 [Fusarium poae]|uniref:Uncharacterized protein n=1 Tax=Fusarium poae TaxID=36050 RepID=A0A1B8ABA3_FUSPO|nr:hypothetical protein FPOA_09498 [Fusarium poae]
MSDLTPLAVTFELRFKRAWSLCYSDKREQAETEAAELLLEPRLGPFHQAGMHLLLAMSPNDYVDHALEAVRLYTAMETQELTDPEKGQLSKLVQDANNILNLARQDKTRIDREVQKMMASGLTLDELHDAQIDEMHKRLDAEEAPEGSPGGEGEDQDDASLIKDSQMTGTDSQRTDSQRTDSQRTGYQSGDSQTTVTYSRDVSVAESKLAVTGDLDDDEPLPDIVRYTKDV